MSWQRGRWFAFALLVATPAAVAAQENRPARPPQFKSPEIGTDKAVAFRIFAPEAKSVRLDSGDMMALLPRGTKMDMGKHENGVWEIKVPDLKGGAYRYNFNVDGVAVIDPRNPATSESNANTWSLVTVPGSPVADLTDVPHGAVASIPYMSKALGRPRRLHVYTPPGYEAGTEKLPVLYLLHGASDSDASWSTVGKAGLVLDNLIAAGKAKPMLVVMPAGHTGAFGFGGAGFMSQMDEFANDFVTDVRPLIEKNYRVSTERKDRAIAGLSMGGAQTLDVAFSNLGDYAYVGVFSSGVFGITGPGPGGNAPAGPSWEEKHKDGLEKTELRDGLKLVWFGTGKEDFLVETSRATVKMLEGKGFQVTYKENDGGHTWVNWREVYLPEFAQLLFQ